VPDSGDDDVVDPLVRARPRLGREDADGRPAGALRAARGRGHHLAQAAGHDGRSGLGQQPPDLLGALLVLGSAADDRDLDRHPCAMLGE
jgi:hypothetical protein